MCDADRFRERKPGPITPNMLALLARMQATPDVPALSPLGRGPCTLDGRTINGATLNGLAIRDLVKASYDRETRTSHYLLTDRPRPPRLAARGGEEG